jgi:hypothetical protein
MQSICNNCQAHKHQHPQQCERQFPFLYDTACLAPYTLAGTGLVEQVKALIQDAGDGDVVLAALHLASEDDAIKTRTHIPLPVDAFSKRLDNIVTVGERFWYFDNTEATIT